MKKEKWYHIVLYDKEPYACFGIAAHDGRVTQAAPIAAWMIGKQLKDLRSFFLSRRAQVTEIKPNI